MLSALDYSAQAKCVYSAAAHAFPLRLTAPALAAFSVGAAFLRPAMHRFGRAA